MEAKEKINIRQLTALIFVSMLSPAIRVLPAAQTLAVGSAAWLCVPAAALPVLLYLWMMRSLLCNRLPDEGLGELLCRSIGKWPARIVSFVILMWLLFYGGFILRTAAERLLSTIYRGGGVGLLMVTMLIPAAIAAGGSVRNLARTARVLLPILLLMLLIALVCALPNIQLQNLLPGMIPDAGDILRGILPVLNVAALGTYFGFLAGYTKKEPHNGKFMAGWTLVLLAFLFLIVLVTVGALSAEMVGKLQNPFFVVIRDIRVAGVVERVEAVVVLLWMITDFVYIASLLRITAGLMQSTVRHAAQKSCAWYSAVVLLIVGFAVGRSGFDLKWLSEVGAGLGSLVVTVILIPGILLIGRLKKKI